MGNSIYCRKQYVETSYYSTDGKFSDYYPSGAKLCEYTVTVTDDNMRHKQYREWYENGTLHTKCTYENDKLDGQYNEWYENEALHIKCTWVHGKINGPYQEWHKNGHLWKHEVYVNGLKTGNCKEYNTNGTLYQEYEINNNICKLLKLFDEKERRCDLPDGEITVWKLCSVGDTRVYVRLRVPAEARRITPLDTDRKYKSRVEYAYVEQIIDKDGTEYKVAQSCVWKAKYRKVLIYQVGEIVRPDSFDDDVKVAYTSGIHVHRYKDQCDVWLKFK